MSESPLWFRNLNDALGALRVAKLGAGSVLQVVMSSTSPLSECVRGDVHFPKCNQQIPFINLAVLGEASSRNPVKQVRLISFPLGPFLHHELRCERGVALVHRCDSLL